MQTEEQNDYGEYQLPGPTCGPGGNSTLTNQDEADILAKSIEGVPMVAAPQSGGFHGRE